MIRALALLVGFSTLLTAVCNGEAAEAILYDNTQFGALMGPHPFGPSYLAQQFLTGESRQRLIRDCVPATTGESTWTSQH